MCIFIKIKHSKDKMFLKVYNKMPVSLVAGYISHVFAGIAISTGPE